LAGGVGFFDLGILQDQHGDTGGVKPDKTGGAGALEQV
jgi:hypothetical protein